MTGSSTSTHTSTASALLAAHRVARGWRAQHVTAPPLQGRLWGAFSRVKGLLQTSRPERTAVGLLRGRALAQNGDEGCTGSSGAAAPCPAYLVSK